MKSCYDVVIVGAGPAGLACARICAAHGASVVVFERKGSIGNKVCAGGITSNGLIERVGDISQRNFTEQQIITPWQKATICEKKPIIATVSRRELGEMMAAQAREAGAAIYTNCRIVQIGENNVLIKQKGNGEEITQTIQYKNLVGADGSTSIVRRYLGLSTECGTGINYQLPIVRDAMEWHLNPARFASGYAWIFPHRETTSIGAYADAKMRSALQLKKELAAWAKERQIDLEKTGKGQLQAENINFNYQGVEFLRKQRIFLAGDAAGLASALTGEGIFPAIVSGEYVGNKIITPTWQSAEFTNMVKKHASHKKMLLYARKHPKSLGFLCELSCFLLRTKIIPFSAAEMAG